VVAALVLFLVFAGFLAYRAYRPSGGRLANVLAWLRDPSAHPEWAVRAGQRCGGVPFIFPTSGFIGFLWDDSFRVGHRHQGIDIFGGTPGNVTPVIAAYPGYLTRLPDWRSSVIIRIPHDPLQPGRQIWTYYTHMANPDGESFISPEFPPGTRDVYVAAGTLLGYQGNYSGTPDNPVGVHLHFSIVLDDGNSSFRNELDIDNTLDPSPYLGLPLNAKLSQGEVVKCEENNSGDGFHWQRESLPPSGAG
jgi:murein DD-endopeptidase MepM/ murein hydrolase activator NlpD